MSDLVGNPEDRFSRVEAHIFSDLYSKAIDCGYSLERPCRRGSLYPQTKF